MSVDRLSIYGKQAGSCGLVRQAEYTRGATMQHTLTPRDARMARRAHVGAAEFVRSRAPRSWSTSAGKAERAPVISLLVAVFLVALVLLLLSLL
jgi:hypothetical protein